MSSKKKIKQENKLLAQGINPKEHWKKVKHLQVSYSKLILNKGSFFALLTVLLDVIQWTFFDPILTARFEDLNVSETSAGFSFLALSIPYTISCYFMHYFESKLGYKVCL